MIMRLHLHIEESFNLIILKACNEVFSSDSGYCSRCTTFPFQYCRLPGYQLTIHTVTVEYDTTDSDRYMYIYGYTCIYTCTV